MPVVKLYIVPSARRIEYPMGVGLKTLIAPKLSVCSQVPFTRKLFIRAVFMLILYFVLRNAEPF